MRKKEQGQTDRQRERGEKNGRRLVLFDRTDMINFHERRLSRPVCARSLSLSLMIPLDNVQRRRRRRSHVNESETKKERIDGRIDEKSKLFSRPLRAGRRQKPTIARNPLRIAAVDK